MALPTALDKHGPTQLNTTATTLIASDGTNQHLIRTITIVNTDSVTETVRLGFTDVTDANLFYDSRGNTFAANETRVLNVFIVVPTSTVVAGAAGTNANKVTVTISGYHAT